MKDKVLPILIPATVLLALIAVARWIFYVASVKPVVFWTDGLIYLLTFIGLSFAFYARRHEHLRAPWRQVKRRRLGMSAVVVLSAYLIVGLLDSIHFQEPLENTPDRQTNSQEVQYSGDVVSVLDKIATRLRSRVEKTYSAPFATHLFVKETIEMPDGTQERGYPRLKYGGAYLKDPEKDRVADITVNIIKAVTVGLLVSALVTMLVALSYTRFEQRPFYETLKRLVRGETQTPWHVILLTMSIMVVLLAISVQLCTKYHIFGTDKVGQDVFYQAVKSVRTGLVIGTLTTLIMLPFAVMLGIMAGYFRGWVDDIIQYIYTTLNSIPGVLLIAAAILMLQVYIANHEELFTSVQQRADLRLLFLCIILGITSWTGLCRLLRGEALKLREMDYIQSATALGVGYVKIIGRHILPNVMHIVLISVVLDFSGLVLAEAVLSYVGVGVDPIMNSWGNMINQARMEMARDPMVWWSLAAAFVFMFVLVLAANLFSDAVRDAFDPRMRAKG